MIVSFTAQEPKIGVVEMFSTEAGKRLNELQAKSHLTRGEEIEVKHLIDLKWNADRLRQITSVSYPAAESTEFKRPDIEALKKAADAARKAQKVEEDLRKLQGQ